MSSKEFHGLFRYPLCIEGLGAVVFTTLYIYLLAFVGAAVYYMTPFAYSFYLIGLVPLIFLSNVFIEYGLGIIEVSFRGQQKIPVLSAETLNRGRFLNQLMMTSLFGTLIWRLFALQFDYIALLILIFLLFAFPASLAVNAIYEKFLDVINPVMLIGFISVIGLSYLPVILGFALLISLFYSAYQYGVLPLLIFLPFGLYLLLVLFRLLGTISYRYRNELVPVTELDGDETKIAEFYDTNETMHKVLESAYWHLKDGRESKAIEIISPVIQLGDWSRFDSAFEYMQDWPNKNPAMHFTKLYIPILIERNNAMRAHSLCEWMLKHAKEYSVENDADLQKLVAAAASREQEIVAVKLLDNFVTRQQSHPLAANYLTMAADICQSRLHHQEKFDELQKKIEDLLAT